jgi:5-methylcytosine-specific restriction endonuclease McrA
LSSDIHQQNAGAVEVAETVRGWTSPDNLKESARLRAEARKAKRCVWCGKPLTGRLRVYCSASCSNAFSLKYYGHSWWTTRQQVIARDNHTCRLCGKLIHPKEVTRPDGVTQDAWCNCEVDHIREVDNGGTDALENLWTLCHACHTMKTAAYIRKKSWRPSLPASYLLLNPWDYLNWPFQEVLVAV